MKTMEPKSIAISSITFLVGILISAITMYGFMEARIAKRVRESMRLSAVESDVSANEKANKILYNSLKDQIWTNDQNFKAQFSDISKRLSSIEARINKSGPNSEE